MTSSSLWNLREWPDPCLNEKCSEGDIPDGLVDEMKAVVKAHNAYGLACSQLGVTSCRVFVMRDLTTSDIDVFANPVIVERSKETYVDTEGCLSFPGQGVRVVRSKIIDVEFDDPEPEFPVGERLTWHFEGINARCVQHEIDHLDGIMIFDHINSNLIRKTTLEKYFKKRRQRARLDGCQLGR